MSSGVVVGSVGWVWGSCGVGAELMWGVCEAVIGWCGVGVG